MSRFWQAQIASANREVRLAHTGRPEEQDVFLAGEKGQRGEIEHLGSVERRLEGEVEVSRLFRNGRPTASASS